MDYADSLKGAVALLRYANTASKTHAYALCYATQKEGRYMAISQAGSWDKTPNPRKVRVGAVGGMDVDSFGKGQPLDPKDFPHGLVGLLDLPEKDRRLMEAMGVRPAAPGERRLPQ